MKKVFLYAYDRQNLGDDLFVHTITRRYPGVQFYLWSGKENLQTFASLLNLKVIDKNSGFVHLLQKLRPSLIARYRAWLENRCDAVVYIGGSIFMEYPNWAQISNWWDYEAENRPFYVLGANFGPWHSPEYRARMAEIFGKMQDICFRDRYSRDLFAQVDTVRCAPDILFSYPVPKVPVKEKQLFVSAINCAGRDESHNLNDCDAAYTANMARLLRGYREQGWQIVFASFCQEEGDEAGIAKILDAMDCSMDSNIRILRYDGTNAAELTTAMAESRAVIATRFHGAILAMAAGRPVLPVVYSDKTLHVLEDLGFRGRVYDLRKDEMWEMPESWEAQLHPMTDQLRKDAQGHFEKLDRVLS